MSLINQMLKDLERRRATSVNPDGSVLQGVSWPGWRENQSRHGMTAFLVALLCIAVSAAGVVWYQARQNSALTVAVPAGAAEVRATQKVDRPVQRQVVIPAVVVETNAVMTEPGAASGDIIRAQGEQTKVASIAPLNTRLNSSSPEVLVTADVTPVETRPVERTTPAPGRDDNTSSTMTKTPRKLSSAQQAEAQYQRALRYYRGSQYALAEPALHKTLMLDVGHMAARELLVAMLIRGGRYTGVEKLLAEGLDMFPQQISFIQLKARMLMQQGNGRAALQVLEQNEPAIDAEPAYHALRAALYQRSGQHEQAAGIYAKLVGLPNAIPAWWVGYAISQEAMGQSLPALESYRRAAANKGLSSKLHAYVSDKIRQLASH